MKFEVGVKLDDRDNASNPPSKRVKATPYHEICGPAVAICGTGIGTILKEKLHVEQLRCQVEDEEQADSSSPGTSNHGTIVLDAKGL